MMRAWLRSRWRGALLFFAVMGPGVITGNVDNDANGITTYSLAGAVYGYRLLWTLAASTVALVVVQEMVARMGAVTGKGLADLIRERFRVRLTVLAMGILMIANWANTAGDFAGVAGAMEIFHVSRYVAVPLAALLVWVLVIRGNYRSVERVFLLAIVIYVTYVFSAVLAKPPWGTVLKATVLPSFQIDAKYIAMTLAVVGTTIAPWMQFYQQAAVVDKGIRVEDYGYERLDTYVGSISTNVIAFFIIVACGATLFVHGVSINDAKDAALALAPLAGRFASTLFAIGLLNAGLFSVAIIPLSTAYAVCEAFGWEAGLDRGFREAPAFFGLYTGLVISGAVVILIPGIPLIAVSFLSQVLNGILLPFILIFLVILTNDARLMGTYRNSFWFNVVSLATVVTMIILTLAYLVTSVWSF